MRLALPVVRAMQARHERIPPRSRSTAPPPPASRAPTCRGIRWAIAGTTTTAAPSWAAIRCTPACCRPCAAATRRCWTWAAAWGCWRMRCAWMGRRWPIAASTTMRPRSHARRRWPRQNGLADARFEIVDLASGLPAHRRQRGDPGRTAVPRCRRRSSALIVEGHRHAQPRRDAWSSAPRWATTAAAAATSRLTDRLANLIGWMQFRPECYPDADALRAQLDAAGLQTTFSPLYGNTPFNNWLIVATSREHRRSDVSRGCRRPAADRRLRSSYGATVCSGRTRAVAALVHRLQHAFDDGQVVAMRRAFVQQHDRAGLQLADDARHHLAGSPRTPSKPRALQATRASPCLLQRRRHERIGHADHRAEPARRLAGDVAQVAWAWPISAAMRRGPSAQNQACGCERLWLPMPWPRRTISRASSGRAAARSADQEERGLGADGDPAGPARPGFRARARRRWSARPAFRRSAGG